MTGFGWVLAGMLAAAGPSAGAASPEEDVVTDPGLPVGESSCEPGGTDSTWIDRNTGAPCVPVEGQIPGDGSIGAPSEQRPDERPGGTMDDTAPGGQGLPAENRSEIGNAPPPDEVDVPATPDDFTPTNPDPGGGSGSILSPGVGGTPTPRFTPAPAGDPRR